MNAKHYRLSKTLWFALALAILIPAEQNLHFIEHHVPAWLYGWLGFLIPVVIAVLRFFTTTAITLTKPEAKDGSCSAP